ncbi:DeoR/GlpR family DNA-binding transcription regulator [Falsiroseomonas oryzae]|uniref:DeoR/GlpR family DNA-binding transcription regulator n=1 Tax=Falsiroseomonas oryzae TaxID=2766473 RepID=UPI0022EA54DB|nr:DeoR/GlpR family DNA-binding transcription regulator [Roseomonas sp. MO-31]
MGRPLAIRRQEEILRRVGAEGAAGVGDLAAALGVSHETVRRDLKALAARGLLAVVHGGAVRHQPVEAAFADRIAENAAGKAAIARAAAALVPDGSVLLIDSGTTTLALAQALGGKRGLTVCTTSLAAALHLVRHTTHAVHLLGGEVDRGEEATAGVDTLAAIGRFRVDLAFIGAGGLTPDGEVTDYGRAAAEQRQHMMRAAARSWLLLDSTKFGRLTPMRLDTTGANLGLVVDAEPPAAARRALRKRGIEILVAA